MSRDGKLKRKKFRDIHWNQIVSSNIQNYLKHVYVICSIIFRFMNLYDMIVSQNFEYLLREKDLFP